jgi:iron complex transport system permease protein
MARPVRLALASVLLLAIAVVSLTVGARPIDPVTVFQALLQPDLSDPAHAVVWDGRVPRTLLGLVVGAGIAAAGALIQALTRNPLADPGILGVNAGASFAVVIAVGVVGVTTLTGQVWFALGGALLATVAVALIGRGRSTDPIRLVLAGVAFSAVLEGIGQGLALVDPQSFDVLRGRGVGSIDIGRLEPVGIAAIFIAVGLVLAAIGARGLNAIALGDEVASALGARVGATRAVTVLAITVLAGAASAVAGIIVFLGLMIPHLARALCGPDNRWVLAFSLVLGPALLLLADVIGRLVLPGELPAGIVVAFVGAPVLVALARQRKAIVL